MRQVVDPLDGHVDGKTLMKIRDKKGSPRLKEHLRILTRNPIPGQLFVRRLHHDVCDATKGGNIEHDWEAKAKRGSSTIIIATIAARTASAVDIVSGRVCASARELSLDNAVAVLV